MFLVIYIVLFLLASFYLYARYKLSYWSRRGVKSPPPHLIFGNFKDTLTFRKSPGQALQELYKSCHPNEPYLGFYVFHQPKLLLRDLELIKQLYIKDFSTFCNRNFGGSQQCDPVGLASLLSARQPLWGYLKHKVTPCMTSSRLKEMLPLVRQHLQPMLQYVKKSENDGEWTRIEAKEFASRFTTDVLASLAFGVTTNSFDEDKTEFWKNGQTILFGTKRELILLILFFLPGLAKYIKTLIGQPAKYLRFIFWDSINTREKTGIKRGDMVDHFISLKNGEQRPDYKFEGDNLLAQAESMFTAGYDATATLLAYTLYELSNHPEYQEQVYQEIEKILSKETKLDLDTLNQMTFLDQVINEVQRLHPSLAFIDRVTEQNYKLPGSELVIEKGTVVYISLNALNRDPRYFERPDEFVPMRSRAESADLPNSTLSFGIGQRSCLGRRLALLITKIAVIEIITNYTLVKDKGKECSMKPISVFNVDADGVHIKLRKRK